MKSIRTYILTAIFAALTLAGFAQKQSPPEGSQPQDFKLPATDTKKLQNGLTSTLVPYGNIPKVHVQVIIKTGNVHEGPEEIWLSDLTGNLLQEGTKTMDSKTIARKVAGMGGQVNVSTGENQTIISGSVLSEFGPALIAVLADIAMNPAFPEAELGRLKNDLKRQLTVQKSVPQAQAQEKFRGAIYGDHPYGRIFPTEAMIDSYTIDKIRSFYENNYGAKRTVVYAAGKFETNDIQKAIEDAFGSWKDGPEVQYPEAKPVTRNDVAIIDRPGAPQTTIMLGLPTLDPSHKDYLPLTVANTLLGGSFGSRITSNIREDKGYTYSPFSTVNAGYRAAVWYEQADVTAEHTGDALQEIAKEIKRLQTETPSESELKGIQNYQAGVFVLQNSTPEGIISQLNFLDLHGLDKSYLTDRVKNIHKVTPEEVSKIAREHFRYEDMTLVLVGDKKLLEKQISSHQASMKAR